MSEKYCQAQHEVLQAPYLRCKNNKKLRKTKHFCDCLWVFKVTTTFCKEGGTTWWKNFNRAWWKFSRRHRDRGVSRGFGCFNFFNLPGFFLRKKSQNTSLNFAINTKKFKTPPSKNFWIRLCNSDSFLKIQNDGFHSLHD